MEKKLKINYKNYLLPLQEKSSQTHLITTSQFKP